MRKERKEKKFSLSVRFLGFFCTLFFIGSIFYIISVGLSFASGLLVAASFAGVVGPSVVAGDGIIDVISGIFELVIESVQTIFEMIFDVIGSIFG